jgi:hypothetical protein
MSVTNWLIKHRWLERVESRSTVLPIKSDLTMWALGRNRLGVNWSRLRHLNGLTTPEMTTHSADFKLVLFGIYISTYPRKARNESFHRKALKVSFWYRPPRVSVRAVPGEVYFNSVVHFDVWAFS